MDADATIAITPPGAAHHDQGTRARSCPSSKDTQHTAPIYRAYGSAPNRYIVGGESEPLLRVVESTRCIPQRVAGWVARTTENL